MKFAVSSLRCGTLALAGGVVLASCAAPPTAPPTTIFLDSRFAPPAEAVDVDSVFALSEPMRRYLRFDIAPQLRDEGKVRGLIDALYERSQLKIEYDASRTRNAAEAFAARRGNCLSLVIMTAALAKELRLEVTYQSVADVDTWSRHDDLAFHSTHVNLTLGRRAIDRAGGYDSGRELTVDFLPSDDILGLHTVEIPERQIVAMYLNNRAAEALARGDSDDGYWLARGAILQAPDFLPAYNTLGVVYLRHGDLGAARATLEELMRRDPKDAQALSNLAIVEDQLDRPEEAARLRLRLAQIEPEAPFHHYFLGLEAMRHGDWREARAQFSREVARADYSSEFHFWLGLADLQLGDVGEARHQMTLALASSVTDTDRDIYAAKLEKLRSLGVH